MQLEELFLIPTAGLCNRLRAIASARRLGQILNCSVTVVWNWEGWGELFLQDESCHATAKLPERLKGELVIHTKLYRNGGEVENQRLPFPNSPVCIVKGGHCFSFEGCPVNTAASLREYYPRRSAMVAGIVDEFVSRHFTMPTAGIHIRRTYSQRAVSRSPDALFLKAASELVKTNHRIFLGTDNEKTILQFEKEFASAILTRPKVNQYAKRWPRRQVTLADVLDDWIDLLLLARCDHVLGSYYSSFSETAIVMNGNPASKVLTK